MVIIKGYFKDILSDAERGRVCYDEVFNIFLTNQGYKNPQLGRLQTCMRGWFEDNTIGKEHRIWFLLNEKELKLSLPEIVGFFDIFDIEAREILKGSEHEDDRDRIRVYTITPTMFSKLSSEGKKTQHMREKELSGSMRLEEKISEFTESAKDGRMGIAEALNILQVIYIKSDEKSEETREVVSEWLDKNDEYKFIRLSQIVVGGDIRATKEEFYEPLGITAKNKNHKISRILKECGKEKDHKGKEHLIIKRKDFARIREQAETEVKITSYIEAEEEMPIEPEPADDFVERAQKRKRKERYSRPELRKTNVKELKLSEKDRDIVKGDFFSLQRIIEEYECGDVEAVKILNNSPRILEVEDSCLYLVNDTLKLKLEAIRGLKYENEPVIGENPQEEDTEIVALHSTEKKVAKKAHEQIPDQEGKKRFLFVKGKKVPCISEQYDISEFVSERNFLEKLVEAGIVSIEEKRCWLPKGHEKEFREMYDHKYTIRGSSLPVVVFEDKEDGCLQEFRKKKIKKRVGPIKARRLIRDAVESGINADARVIEKIIGLIEISVLGSSNGKGLRNKNFDKEEFESSLRTTIESYRNGLMKPTANVQIDLFNNPRRGFSGDLSYNDFGLVYPSLIRKETEAVEMIMDVVEANGLPGYDFFHIDYHKECIKILERAFNKNEGAYRRDTLGVLVKRLVSSTKSARRKPKKTRKAPKDKKDFFTEDETAELDVNPDDLSMLAEKFGEGD